MHYREIAEAILAEVGLRFEDVIPRPRRGERLTRYSGRVYRGPDRKPVMQVTLPVDSPLILWIIGHEAGHIHHRHLGTSIRDYIKEYQAERYAEAALLRHGIEPHPWNIEQGKKYVRKHCWAREWTMGKMLAGDPYAWSREVVEWCGFTPKYGELYV